MTPAATTLLAGLVCVLSALCPGTVQAAAAMPAPARAPMTTGPSSCIACHSRLTGKPAAPVVAWTSDVHAQAGLGCESCHGGNPAPELAQNSQLAKAAAAGFKSGPDRFQVADFCGQCHSNAAFMKRFDPKISVLQLAEYRTSVHGRRNAQGDPRPATCIDCHGAHGILPVSSPKSPVYAANVPGTCAHCHADPELMSSYDIPTDQYAKYRRSMHSAALLDRGDTAAPACNDCHGSHGALSPGGQGAAQVCGTCHGREAKLFNASFKKDLFETLEVGSCTVCHDPHRVRHPTPELFRPGSAPHISQGQQTSADPFAADLGRIGAGDRATVLWVDVLHPYLDGNDPRLTHQVKIHSAGQAPLLLDATVHPGEDPAAEPPRVSSSGALRATLTISLPAGPPADAGDPLLFHLQLQAAPDRPAPQVQVEDQPGEGLDSLEGSACRNCHSPGDDCDVATKKMYGALMSMDRDLRQAGQVLRRAEMIGMEVKGARFDLKSKGKTADVESRALLHSFDTERLVGRAQEGSKVASAAHQAGEAALEENQVRRKGLAVSLVLVLLVLGTLYAKIRQVERRRTYPS